MLTLLAKILHAQNRGERERESVCVCLKGGRERWEVGVGREHILLPEETGKL